MFAVFSSLVEHSLVNTGLVNRFLSARLIVLLREVFRYAEGYSDHISMARASSKCFKVGVKSHRWRAVWPVMHGQ